MIIITDIARRIFSIYCALIMAFFSSPAGTVIEVDHSTDNTNYPYVFVNGYFGYGEYNVVDETYAYWGLSTGRQIDTFNNSGFVAAAADVDPVGSAWDRACELYAQLKGTVVDYGKAHSEKYGHERYGKDYTGNPLVAKWDRTNKVNIVGHSFGGPTCALFVSILEYGSDEEVAATTDGSLSDFFKGGKGNTVYSVTGIAGAYNGTTMCIPAEKVDTFLNGGVKAVGDNGMYDMHPDNAAKLNETIKAVDSIYYFTVPCCSSTKICGKNVPIISKTDLQFSLPSVIICAMNTVTDGGIMIDELWQPNDGMVNTISEIGPFNSTFNYVEASPSTELAASGFDKGVYNVFETYSGSHMSIMGNITIPNPDGTIYLSELMKMINAIK